MARTSLEKITQGLNSPVDEHGARRPGDSRDAVVPLAGRARMHATDVRQARLRLEEAERRVRAIIDATEEARVEDARAIQAEWMAETELDLGVRTQLARKRVDARNAEYRASMLAMLRPVVAECHQLNGIIQGQRSLHVSRAQQLQIYGIGTPERAAIEATCSKSGAVGLLSIAQQADALMRSDEPADQHLGKLMAAAAVLEAGSRPRGDVLFNRKQLIEGAPMPEHDMIAGAIQAGESSMRSIEAMVRGVTTGHVDDAATIERALDRRDGLGPEGEAE
jgi:hypothetical protein